MEYESALKEGSMSHPPNETREQREEITKQALSQVIRERMYLRPRRMYQTVLASRSGISRSKMRSILLARQNTSLLIFLEMCDGLSVDHCELLREVLNQRDVIRRVNSNR